MSDRLLETRYPADFAGHTRADWARWLRDVSGEAEAVIIDETRWSFVHVLVDDVADPGVAIAVDDTYTAGAAYLPEGRLDIGIERHATDAPHLDIEELRIGRSTDLDQINWSPERDEPMNAERVSADPE